MIFWNLGFILMSASQTSRPKHWFCCWLGYLDCLLVARSAVCRLEFRIRRRRTCLWWMILRADRLAMSWDRIWLFFARLDWRWTDRYSASCCLLFFESSLKNQSPPYIRILPYWARLKITQGSTCCRFEHRLFLNIEFNGHRVAGVLEIGWVCELEIACILLWSIPDWILSYFGRYLHGVAQLAIAESRVNEIAKNFMDFYYYLRYWEAYLYFGRGSSVCYIAVILYNQSLVTLSITHGVINRPIRID